MNLKESVHRADALAQFFGVFFAGQEPGVIGGTLAQLMATFLVNHKIPDDLAEQERLREELLGQWCATVRELIAADEMDGATKQ